MFSPEGGLDLTAGVDATLVLARESVVFEVVQPDPRIIGCY